MVTARERAYRDPCTTPCILWGDTGEPRFVVPQTTDLIFVRLLRVGGNFGIFGGAYKGATMSQDTR